MLSYNPAVVHCRASLADLGLAYFDLYIVHWPSGLVPNKAKHSNIDIRYWHYSIKSTDFCKGVNEQQVLYEFCRATCRETLAGR